MDESTKNTKATIECRVEHSVSPSAWYVAAMERLVGVVQELSQARDIDAITAIVRSAARRLTGADGATFVLRDCDQCYYADEDAISPLWKGRRFPMSACISGWVMLHGRSTVIEDIYSDARIPADAYRPTFVKSLAMVPIRRNAPIGAIGNYWATQRQPTEEEVAILQALADTTSVALENAQLYAELQAKVQTLQERERRIHEQRDALEVFTRALAHDLKEPVRAIRSFAELMAQCDPSSAKAQGYFQHIRNAAERMSMLIDTVFLYTQLDDPVCLAKERCDMGQVLEAVQENLQRLICERRAVISSDRLPEVDANPAQMLQVVQHLIANALHHGKAAVTVHIGAEEVAEGWRFSVRDDGPGIAPAYLEKIFVPFKRLANKEERAGLGLAICRKILDLHGGRIWCASEPGQGAVFFFTLPRPTMIVATVSSPAVASIEELPLARVLLVDDREADIELTQAVLLERAGLRCHLLVARDAEEAWGMLREGMKNGSMIDLMLLDINMPGTDGFELLERMRQDAAMQCVVVVMCTGSTYEKDRQRAQSLGAVGYLVKPPSMEQLQPILEQAASVQLLSCAGNGYTLVRAA